MYYYKVVHFLFVMSNKGFIISIKDQIIITTGLFDCFVGELVNIVDYNSLVQGQGLVMNLESDIVRLVLIKGLQKNIKSGYKVLRTFNAATTRCGYSTLGTLLSPLGDFLNSFDFSDATLAKKNLMHSFFNKVNCKAPSIIERSTVRFPLFTGIAMIDCFLPIGRGQRELIIGDINTGKTTLALTIVLNQRISINKINYIWRAIESTTNHFRKHSRFMPCIYILIGKRRSELLRIKYILVAQNAFNYTCIVFSGCDELAALQYVAPYAGTTIGEWFRTQGYHALVIYDDLSEHAVAYRQLSLLLRRPPGREAYPGDIFYIHSSLLERSGQLKRTVGNGSVTSFPLIETKGGDITSYIPTNVISITDGQIFLSKTLVNKNIRPSIDLTVSVSRIGSKAQYTCLKFVCKKVRSIYATFKTFENVAKVTSDLDPVTELYINRGLSIIQFLNQPLYHTYTLYNEVLGFFLLSEGYLDGIKTKYVNLFFNLLFKAYFAKYYLEEHKHLLKYIIHDNCSIVESLLKMYSVEPFLTDWHVIGKQYNNFFKNELQLLLVSGTFDHKQLYTITKPSIWA